uniref:THAP-type domain-containing protein n=1 Tax=Chinchilla lanigera TaxID=34839 RepID=A0A8C2V050_CHILA
PNLCAALNCTRRTTQSNLAFFRVLKDPARCPKPDQLNKHRLCAKHFETSMICRTLHFSPHSSVPRDDAIPTIFDLTSHLNNPHSRHRKRIKELSEDEIRTLKQKRIDETSGQGQKHKETNNSSAQNPSAEVQDEDILPFTLEKKENKEYLKSLLEILIRIGKQNIPRDGHETEEIPKGLFTPDNFQALLECLINSGEDVLRKRFEITAVNTLFCSKTQQQQMLEICEPYIAGEELLLVLVRFVDESHHLREECVGFLPYEADAEILAVKFHTTITEQWGLNMEYCRGQAYIVSRGFSSKMKIKNVASRLLEKYPQAIYTLCSSRALNMQLAKSVAVVGYQLRICSFFHQLPQLLLELDNVISVLFQNSEERGKELKEICHSPWTGRHDAFEVLVDLVQALVLCLDGINNDTSIRLNNYITGRAYVLCSAMTDFDFIVTIVVLKNVLSFTRASGKNLQGQTLEVMENIEVYHEFWLEEATNLATTLDIQRKLPGKFHRTQQGSLESQLTSESYYKETLNVPTELKHIFSEQHRKALKCLSLVPSVMGQLKFNTSEEHHADTYRSDLLNPNTLSAELHCWRIKWKHRGKVKELPSTIYEALHLLDIKFFPNVYALLKVLCILPVMKVENERYENGRKCLKAYLRNTLKDQRSSNLALLNVNLDIKHDLDLMMGTYIKLYTTESELPADNSETVENT